MKTKQNKLNSIGLNVTEHSTLLSFLSENLKGKSRNNVKSMIKRGQIRVDNKTCKDNMFPLKPGATLVIENHVINQKALQFKIIFEDDELIVIDKPAGLLPIASEKERENTAYHLVNDYIKSKNKSGRIFIVHRLDRETSGIMLFSKNEKLKFLLQDNWEECAIERKYIALVEGEVLDKEGKIRSWLKQTKTLLMYSSEKSGDGKLAMTLYKTLDAKEEYSQLEVTILTGRKNQIRVHMSDIGHPIAGDKKYGAKTNPLGRLCLHASKLTIRHPITEEVMNFESRKMFRV